VSDLNSALSLLIGEESDDLLPPEFDDDLLPPSEDSTKSLKEKNKVIEKEVINSVDLSKDNHDLDIKKEEFKNTMIQLHYSGMMTDEIRDGIYELLDLNPDNKDDAEFISILEDTITEIGEDSALTPT